MVRAYGRMEAVECSRTLPLCRGKGAGHDHHPRARPRSLPTTTTKLQTEFGSLFVTILMDEDGEPFEVFGRLVPARGHRAGLPSHLPAPAGRHAGRGKCAASRGIGYPAQPGGIRRRFLGQPTYLEAKA